MEMSKVSKSVYKTKEFRRLKKHWYEQLKISGFVDIDPNDKRIVPSQEFNWLPSEVIRADHGMICAEILQNTKFKKEWHRRVFEHYTQGLCASKIVEHIKEEYDIEVTIDGITKLINRTKRNHQG